MGMITVPRASVETREAADQRPFFHFFVARAIATPAGGERALTTRSAKGINLRQFRLKCRAVMRPKPSLLLSCVLCVGFGFGCKEKNSPAASQPATSAPPPAAESPSPDVAKKYGTFLTKLAARVESEFAAMHERKFESQAEVFTAMAAIAPTGAKMHQHIEAALVEAGLSREQVAGLVKEPTAEVGEHARAFTRTVEAVAAGFAGKRRAEVEALPKGDVQAAMERASVEAKKSEGLWILPRPASPLATWTRVRSIDELDAQVSAAAAESQPVVIHFTAEWAMPSKMTERVMFTHDGMRRILFGYRRLYIDVTQRSDTDAAMQLKLGTTALPRTMFFKNARPLADFLRGKGKMPAPSMETGGPQKPQRFAKQLAEAE